MTNFWAFLIFYGVLFGAFSGFMYLPPVVVCCKYFPDKKGLIGGIVLGFYGMSTLIFGFFV